MERLEAYQETTTKSADLLVRLLPDNSPAATLVEQIQVVAEMHDKLADAVWQFELDIEHGKFDLLRQMWKEQTGLNAKTFDSNPGGPQGCNYGTNAASGAREKLPFHDLLEMGDFLKQCHAGEKQSDGVFGQTASVHVNKWLQQYTLAMRQECAELVDSTNWKWWRTKVDKFDLQNVWVELVDILHFWMSACMVAGLTPIDVFEMYMEKNRVNVERQDSGYIVKNEDDSKHISPRSQKAVEGGVALISSSSFTELRRNLGEGREGREKKS